MADNLPLAKHLASTDKKTRDKAIKNLAAFLSEPSRDVLPESEMAKLWKGLFYCYWMSDKPLVQQALSTELADLVLTISSTNAALAFLRGFWGAILREWNGIDRLRMDKYYMLVRKFVNAAFRLLLRTGWEEAACTEYSMILSHKGGVLYPEDSRVPGSLVYHVCDVYLEELDKTLAPPDDSDAETNFAPAPAPLTTLVDPFLHLAARTASTITHQRIQDAMLSPLFSALKPLPPSPPPSPSSRLAKRPRIAMSASPTYAHLTAHVCTDRPADGCAHPDVVRRAVLRRMFDVASGPDTREANRRRMYAVWKTAMAEDDDVEEREADDS